MSPGWLTARGTARRARSVMDATPPGVRRLLVLAAAVGLATAAFAGVVLPLFHLGGTTEPSAELSGLVPDSAVAGQRLVLDVAIDNSGGTGLDPVCVRADFGGPVEVPEVVFQGLDHVPMRNGTACAGKLNGDETITVSVAVVPQAAGLLSVSLRPAQGSRVIGPGIHGTLTVAAH